MFEKLRKFYLLLKSLYCLDSTNKILESSSYTSADLIVLSRITSAPIPEGYEHISKQRNKNSEKNYVYHFYSAPVFLRDRFH